MAQVAANQDRSQAERAHFLYVQHARVISRKGKTIHCEEITDTRVAPTAKGSVLKLLKLDGRLRVKHNYVTYHDLLPEHGDSNVKPEHDSVTINLDSASGLDRDLVENMRKNLTQDDSKDGLSARLFPLTTEDQKGFDYRLIGSENMNGRSVYHIAFQPKDKEEFTWKGDAYIDREALEPVVIRTTQARKIPFAVRTLLGVNLPGLGFTVVYAPQQDKVWFPVSFGTEFKIKVLFFFSREILIAVDNGHFERTHVTMKLQDPLHP